MVQVSRTCGCNRTKIHTVKMVKLTGYFGNEEELREPSEIEGSENWGACAWPSCLFLVRRSSIWDAPVEEIPDLSDDLRCRWAYGPWCSGLAIHYSLFSICIVNI